MQLSLSDRFELEYGFPWNLLFQTIWLVAIILWIPNTLSTVSDNKIDNSKIERMQISFYQAYSFDREVALQTIRDYWPPYEEDLRTKQFHLGGEQYSQTD